MKDLLVPIKETTYYSDVAFLCNGLTAPAIVIFFQKGHSNRTVERENAYVTEREREKERERDRWEGGLLERMELQMCKLEEALNRVNFTPP